MIKFLSILAIVFISVVVSAQISGFVKNDKDEILPYVSIYVQGSSTGTTTNLEGYYELRLDPGNYELVYQYIGHITVTKSVKVESVPINQDVVMAVQPLLLTEVVVAGNAEDPAYEVIRQAIKKRNYYNNIVESYSCDVYVKGNNKILQAPEKVLGVEVGDLEGALDSNRQGIVYLSESVSELYFRRPNDYKEIVTSSKVSGDDRGYSFNSAQEMDFNIYENSIDLNRAIVSPIADNALNYYRYRLEGTYYDDQGRLINRIMVIPRRSGDPSFFGTIFIIEDLWLVQSFSLSLTGQSSQLYFIDTLTFNQIFIPIQEPDIWRLFNNTINFQFSLFGFKIAGKFTAIYSNYAINPDLPKSIFNSITHQVEKESNKRDSLYWDAIRPVPLTSEEVSDYRIKDSIFTIRDSKEYKDSIDRKNNKVNFGSFLGEYTHQNTSEHRYWSISSPISSIAFNTVQGFNAGINFNWRKYYDEEETRRLLLEGNLNYGFSENKLRAWGRAIYRPDRTSSNEFVLFGGSGIEQFNRREPITTSWNTIYTLLGERNLAKYYDRSYVGLSGQTDLASGIVLSASLTYEARQALTNNTDWTLRDRDDRSYTSNQPLNPADDSPLFDNHQAFLLDLGATIRIGQKYVVFPDRRFSDGYKGPLIRLAYKGAYSIAGGDVSYHQVYTSLRQSLDFGVFGSFEYYVNGGTFFDKGRTEFVDFQHFMGNEILFKDKDDIGTTFFLLPYYSRSTADSYAELHAQHHFNGWILDKIPGINKLGFSLVAGAKYLHVRDRPDYAELHLGVDKLGWHFFRLLRADVIYAIDGDASRWGFRIGLGIQ